MQLRGAKTGVRLPALHTTKNFAMCVWVWMKIREHQQFELSMKLKLKNDYITMLMTL
jgi:hypothetical protein